LKKLSYLTRSQLQAIHNLGSARNASRIMKQLEPYVCSFRETENVYYLSAEGRQRVGSRRICKKTPQAKHFIMRNSLYIALGCPEDWKNEIKLKLEGELEIIADALFKVDDRFHIIEVDYTQKMSVNRSKIKKYKRLVEAMPQQPKFYWITTTDYRRKQLLRLCDGLDVQIFTAEDFH